MVQRRFDVEIAARQAAELLALQEAKARQAETRPREAAEQRAVVAEDRAAAAEKGLADLKSKLRRLEQGKRIEE